MIKLTRRQFTGLSGAALLGLAMNHPMRHCSEVAEKIKIGQIGIAHSHAAEKLATLLKLHDAFEFIGLVESDQGLLKAAMDSNDYPGVKWLSEAQLLQTVGLDAVLIETELADLVPTALRCIEAGLHVHVDKPMGTSLPALEKLLSRAAEKKLIVQSGYMFRYHPAFHFCLQAVRQGWLGPIFSVEGVISKAIHRERRVRLAQTYGGGMMLLGCHLIDQAIALCGEPVKVHSFRRRTLSQQDDLYDHELIVMEYDKAVASIKSSLLEIDGKQRRQLVVCGSNGSIEIKPLEPAVVHMTLRQPACGFDKGWQKVDLPEVSGRYDEQLLDFARMIRRKKEIEFSMQHELTVQKVLLQVCKDE
ncbi:Gfo/Idh/MocA family oxidoreductase [candidate division KSB1 bacterium]|nr:Gfo/Idh/MocA family oxidoreductase [candidate division KSB1 bacterium]